MRSFDCHRLFPDHHNIFESAMNTGTAGVHEWQVRTDVQVTGTDRQTRHKSCLASRETHEYGATQTSYSTQDNRGEESVLPSKKKTSTSLYVHCDSGNSFIHIKILLQL